MYGNGTRSYNRSPEAREMKRQRAEATKREEARLAAGRFETIIVGPMCRCDAFQYPHEAIAHLRCLSDGAMKGWLIWKAIVNESYSWPGWAELGTKIRFRRVN